MEENKDYCIAADYGFEKLEKSGLVQRIEYPEIPARVEYQLTRSGIELMPVYEAVNKWCEENGEVFITE